MNKHIAVLTNRWVLIGKTIITDAEVRMTEASVIRVWGTTRGLGQIAAEGPTKNTVLDACGDVVIPRSSVLFLIACAK